MLFNLIPKLMLTIKGNGYPISYEAACRKVVGKKGKVHAKISKGNLGIR